MSKKFKYFIEFNGRDTGARFYTKREAQKDKAKYPEAIRFAAIIRDVEYLKYSK